MSEPYYYDRVFPVADNDEVYFTIEFVSHGNTGESRISLPKPPDPKIKDAGSALLGKGKDLREGITCYSEMANPVDKEDEIRINYKINGVLVVEHVNLKSVEKMPFIEIEVKFPKP